MSKIELSAQLKNLKAEIAFLCVAKVTGGTPTISSKEKDVKSLNLIARAKEEIEALFHHGGKSPLHYKETCEKSDDIDHNTPIDEVKGPNVLEGVKEEIEAVVEVSSPKKRLKRMISVCHLCPLPLIRKVVMIICILSEWVRQLRSFDPYLGGATRMAYGRGGEIHLDFFFPPSVSSHATGVAAMKGFCSHGGILYSHS